MPAPKETPKPLLTQSFPASLAGTQYLKLVPNTMTVGAWFTPTLPDDPLNGGGIAQGPMGRELEWNAPNGRGKFCAQMRLSWLRMNRVMRAEVRVWWFKAGGDRTLYGDCGAGNEDAMQDDTENVQWVYLATTMEPPS